MSHRCLFYYLLLTVLIAAVESAGATPLGIGPATAPARVFDRIQVDAAEPGRPAPFIATGVMGMATAPGQRPTVAAESRECATSCATAFMGAASPRVEQNIRDLDAPAPTAVACQGIRGARLCTGLPPVSTVAPWTRRRAV